MRYERLLPGIWVRRNMAKSSLDRREREFRRAAKAGKGVLQIHVQDV